MNTQQWEGARPREGNGHAKVTPASCDSLWNSSSDWKVKSAQTQTWLLQTGNVSNFFVDVGMWIYPLAFVLYLWFLNSTHNHHFLRRNCMPLLFWNTVWFISPSSGFFRHHFWVEQGHVHDEFSQIQHHFNWNWILNTDITFESLKQWCQTSPRQFFQTKLCNREQAIFALYIIVCKSFNPLVFLIQILL